MTKNNSDIFIPSIKLDSKLKYKKDEFAVVTGGCGRIGSVYTSLLLKIGLNVIVLSRSKKNFSKFYQTLNEKLKKKIIWKKVDLTDSSSINHVCKYLNTKRIRFLINNAAFSNRGKFFTYNANNLNEEIWGTFAGSVLLTEKILPNLRKYKKVKIIFTGSLWGIKTPRFKIYKNLDIGPSPIIAAGKSAILQYARFLAEREAEFGITVNSLLPGWFPRKGKIERKDYINRINNNIPLRRIGQLTDLISAINFLITADNNYFTGQELIVDGGYSLS